MVLVPPYASEAQNVDANWHLEVFSDGVKWGVDKVSVLPSGSPSFDGFALRDETTAFQFAIWRDENVKDTSGRREAAEEELVGISVDGASFSLRGASESEHSDARIYLQVFREDLVQVSKRSHDLPWRPDSAAQPQLASSIVADRLVPASEVSISSSPAVYWVDVWVAPEVSAGVHEARLQFGHCTEPACSIALQIEVLDSRLPVQPSARTMLWFSGGEDEPKYVHQRYWKDPSQVPEADKRALRRKHHQLAREHRITLFWGDHKEWNSELEELLSGKSFSEEYGYRGPAAGAGMDLLVLRAYGGELTFEEAKQWLERSRNFSSLADVFLYAMDEPSPEQLGELARRIEVSRPMPAFVTTPPNEDVAADIFCMLPEHFSESAHREAAAQGARSWLYNGVRPFSGTFVIDDVGVSPRVNPWIQYKHKVERWFYWESTYYYDFQGGRGQIDVGAKAKNFSNKHGDEMNGDGLLIYPGSDHLFPESNLGLGIPLPSIRLKNWRRGIQDVEYLELARKAGFDREVDALLESMLPRSLYQAEHGSAVSWPEEGRSWDLARRYLFELLRDGASDIEVEGLRRSDLPSASSDSRSPAAGTSRRTKLLVGLLVLAVLVLVGGLFFFLRARSSAQRG